MQISNRTFQPRRDLLDEDAEGPIHIRAAAPSFFSRLLVFALACLAGWWLAWGIHWASTAIHAPTETVAANSAAANLLRHGFEILHNALYH